MKKIICTFTVASAAVAALYLSPIHAAAQSADDGTNAVKSIEADSQKTQEEFRTSLRRREALAKAQENRTDALIKAEEGRSKRAEALLARQEELMKRQEAALARYEKIVDTWESQQKQYQKYLDSLKK